MLRKPLLPGLPVWRPVLCAQASRPPVLAAEDCAALASRPPRLAAVGSAARPGARRRGGEGPRRKGSATNAPRPEQAHVSPRHGGPAGAKNKAEQRGPVDTHQAHSARLDTQPSRLAFARVQDHPGHCLLVTAPSAHHTTPHRTTPHHTAPHHTTPHHTTPHHTTPHHTTPHHTTPHHTTPHHTTPHPGRWARFSEEDASPWALKEAPTTPWAGLPVPPRPVGPVLRKRRLPMGLEGGSDHPLGRTPRPPQAGGPGSPKMTPPHGP